MICSIFYLKNSDKARFSNLKKSVENDYVLKKAEYPLMQYTNENTTDYLVRFHNDQKVNEDCNGSLTTKGVQEHGMNILFPFHNTEFDYLQ